MKRSRVRKLIIVLAWIVVWHIGARAVGNNILLVTPLQAMGELLSMLGDFQFYYAAGLSLLRIGGGFLSGFVTAAVLAALSCRHALLEEVLSPVMTLLKAIPVASFVVLLLIWWGSSFLAVAICFVVVLPNVYINTLEGLKNTDRQLLEMAQVFRLSVKSKFFYIYRPAIAPFLYSSLKISLGMCWKSGVAAEVIGTPGHSIGEGLYLSKIYLNTAGVFAWTAVVILLSVLFEKLILWQMRCFFQWQPACSSPTAQEKLPKKSQKENKSVRLQPQELQSQEPQPEEPQPQELQSQEPQPEGPQPQELQSQEPQPQEPQPEEPQPQELQSQEPQPEESQPQELQSQEPQPEEPQPQEPQPQEPKSQKPPTEKSFWEKLLSKKSLPQKPIPAGTLSEKASLEVSPGALSAERICKAFGGRQVLSEVSAVYEPGRVYVLNSPSGSGKTTFLHILAGILKPDAGCVNAPGNCSMVFQEDRLCMDYSAVKNVELVTGNALQAKEALEELLEPEVLQKPCRELSGGMKRRVALVRAMEAEAEYVLLDEPFTGMDGATLSRAKAYIRKKQNDRPVILVTHILSEQDCEETKDCFRWQQHNTDTGRTGPEAVGNRRPGN